MDYPLPPGAVTPDPWKIRLRREALGLTQPQVGEALGLRWPAMYVSRLESYVRQVDEATLTALAALFKCDPSDLCSGAAEWWRNHKTAHESRPWRNVSATEKDKSAKAARWARPAGEVEP